MLVVEFMNSFLLHSLTLSLSFLSLSLMRPGLVLHAVTDLRFTLALFQTDRQSRPFYASTMETVVYTAMTRRERSVKLARPEPLELAISICNTPTIALKKSTYKMRPLGPLLV